MKNGLRRIQFYLSEESYQKILFEIKNSGLTESAFCSEKIAGEKLGSRGAPVGNQNKKRKFKIASPAPQPPGNTPTTRPSTEAAAEPETTFSKDESIKNDVSYIVPLVKTGIEFGTSDLLADTDDSKISSANDDLAYLVEQEASVSYSEKRDKEFQIFSDEELEDIVGDIDDIFCSIIHPRREVEAVVVKGDSKIEFAGEESSTSAGAFSDDFNADKIGGDGNPPNEKTVEVEPEHHNSSFTDFYRPAEKAAVLRQDSLFEI